MYADWLHASGQPIILIYGHYDVQVNALQCCLASVHASLLPNAHLCLAVPHAYALHLPCLQHAQYNLNVHSTPQMPIST